MLFPPRRQRRADKERAEQIAYARHLTNYIFRTCVVEAFYQLTVEGAFDPRDPDFDQDAAWTISCDDANAHHPMLGAAQAALVAGSMTTLYSITKLLDAPEWDDESPLGLYRARGYERLAAIHGRGDESFALFEERGQAALDWFEENEAAINEWEFVRADKQPPGAPHWTNTPVTD